MFTIIWPKLNSISSVAFAVKLITSLTVIFVNDLFRVVLTTGSIMSATTINVEFCLTLLFVSVAYIVKLITDQAPVVIIVTLLIWALAPDRPVKLTFVSMQEIL